MTAQAPTDPTPEELEKRKRVWERVKTEAQRVHDHPKDHGINTVIGDDAGRSSQTVGDWKHGRSPIPPSILAKLGALYEVNPKYLACETDNRDPSAPSDVVAVRARMLELVEQAIQKADAEVSGVTGARMSAIALDMLERGESSATILGTLIFMAEGKEPQT